MEKLRKHFINTGVVLFSAAFAFVATHEIPFISIAEKWLGDYRIATLTPPASQSQEIVIVSITEDTLKSFPYRSPVDRAFLTSVLKKLDADGAKAIGIDVIFDQPTEDSKDQSLKDEIQRIHTPLVIGYLDANEGLSDDQTDFLNDFVPVADRGYVTLIKDGEDLTVRHIYPGRKSATGEFITGFPIALASKINPSGKYAAERIVWRGHPSNTVPPFKA